MSQRDSTVIRLLGQEYRITCQPDEVPILRQSTDLLQQRMQVIEASGKVTGMERIAVMAALNLAHELLQVQVQAAPAADARICALHTQIADALNKSPDMDTQQDNR